MDLFTYLMSKKGQNTQRDLFSYLLGKNVGGSGTYTTFSGTSLNISNTIKAKIKNFMLNSTELTQDGTPTPSSPVDVNVITGDNNIKINQNLAQMYKNNIMSGYALTADGLEAEAEDYVIYIPCESNTQYEIYKVKSERLRIATTIENPATRPQIYQFYNSSDTTYASITTNNEAKYLCIFFRRFSDSLTMQEILDTMNVYKTSQEQNYPITLSSKNLVNIPDITLSGTGYVINQSNLAIPNGTYTLSIQESPLSSFSFNIQDMNGTPYFNATKTLPLTIEATNGIKLIRVYSTSTSGGTFGKIQLEEGSTATTYEPYYNIEYCKIGDYADQIFKNTTNSPYYDSTLELNEWYLKKNINKVVLNGSEDWKFDNNLAYITINDAFGKSSKTYINYFKSVTTTTDVWGDAKFGTSNSNLIFYNAISENTDLVGWKTWLSTHNTKVYYQLATPQYIHISETDYPILRSQLDNLYNNAKSYNGQTNITQTNEDLPFNISVDVKVANL